MLDAEGRACYVRNTGTTSVKVQVRMFSNNGLIVDVGTCNGAALGAGKTCIVFASGLPDDSFLVCSATAGNVSKLRGNVDVRHSFANGANVVDDDDLR